MFTNADSFDRTRNSQFMTPWRYVAMLTRASFYTRFLNHRLTTLNCKTFIKTPDLWPTQLRGFPTPAAVTTPVWIQVPVPIKKYWQMTSRGLSVFVIMTCHGDHGEWSLTPELNPSAQRCLVRFFTGDFASWTVHFVNVCVKSQQMQQ
jgi:hypothetical protein